ncbi:FAD-dependent oxidoreductase [Cupriavidus metallidurans]|uniref:Monooxygenase, FAD-binding:FAD dependent oxidoreductase n=1 Tax=Cupriavidus metallidurans (strain ATCC 43123 / DSM 2839 / NBRC 102507 / CH34) TaxID=266264 RepID=Q1LRK1_CUPMC|nr:FAD-dependent oxidoreductase [Cupriavidus metallidurans]ABF07225.1 Monooxygenase, FAD-binding:FAD dependent oxidoreductase [Cupriavidus metallidurans CH34]AVA32489.1 FAD-dependent oxidoreductase [Cupriavidus metallidurans]QGS28429.1 FAD-dependent oxidoreductase [Cupriavidus metallidurans]
MSSTKVDIDYQRIQYDYVPCAEQRGALTNAAPHPVIVVGAGPIGLATAIDLARHGVPVVVVDDDCMLSVGSRAICFAKRTLDIFDRLGCGDRMVDKGVRWNLGKVFLRDSQVYAFDLLPESDHQRPAFINLQQYYLEGYLLECAQAMPNIEIRWKSKAVAIEQHADHVTLTIETPDGCYALRGAYVVAADGSRSPLRKMLGLESHGHTFRDRFLIADVKMEAPFPAERWFWFDPPFHPNQSVLLHRQPDNVWRIDFQLGWDADPAFEKTPERVLPRVQALLGPDAKFELEWVSVYTFSCVRMDSFRHGRVLFAGDSAHCVSPFGARGANSGVQDAENLAWKLAYVLQGKAPESLLDTYASEREFAADENILNSTRSTDFITPKSAVSRIFRDAVLTLARDHAFARQLVNSGRLSVPAVLRDSPLNTADAESFSGQMVPGAACVDAPVAGTEGKPWLLPHLGDDFVALIFGAPAGIDAACREALTQLLQGDIPLRVVFVTDAAISASAEAWPGAVVLRDAGGVAARRYDARAGTCYLIRPDQHVCARWRAVDANQIAGAIARATCNAAATVAAQSPAAARTPALA